MKSKRGSNKIYYYIDLFFILLPIIFFIFIFLYNLITLSNDSFVLLDNGSPIASSPSLSNYTADLFNRSFSRTINEFSSFIDEPLDRESGFIYDIYNVMFSIFDFFGINADYANSINLFIFYYFIYLAYYEIFSLLFNIIMWLPRWCRNKVRDCNGSDSV